MHKDFLFVYGTLRKHADSPARRLLPDHSRFIGKASCQGRLFRAGHYPALVPTLHRDERVYGEVYRLFDTAKAFLLLDRYEGYQKENRRRSEYLRVRQPVRLQGGRLVFAWVYIYNRPTDNLSRIHSGDFLSPY